MKYYIAFFLMLYAMAPLAAKEAPLSTYSTKKDTLGLNVSDIIWEGDCYNHEYNPLDSSTLIQNIPFDVTYKKNASTHYFVTVSQGQSSSYNRYLSNGKDTISYTLSSDKQGKNTLKAIPDATLLSDVITGVLEKNDKSSFETRNYYISIPPGQIVAPGHYTDTFIMKIYKGKVDKAFFEQEVAAVTVSAFVSPITQVSLVSTGRNFSAIDTDQTVDFGDIRTAMEQKFDMRIRSNAGYTVSMFSENDGVMKQDGVDSTIPYTLKANGVLCDLHKEHTSIIASGSGVTDYNGDCYNLSLMVGKPSKNAVAGIYHDLVYVTVTSME